MTQRPLTPTQVMPRLSLAGREIARASRAMTVQITVIEHP